MNVLLLAATETLSVSPLRIAIGATMIAVAMVVATCALTSLGRRDRARLGPTTRRMCRALGVARGERRLIDLVARRMGAPGAALLVSRGFFDRAVVLAPASERPRLGALRQRLFDRPQG